MGLIKAMKAMKKSIKAGLVVDRLYLKGAFNSDEMNSLITIVSFYYFNDVRTEEQLIPHLESQYERFHSPANINKDCFKQNRRTVNRLLLPGFRGRMFDFCLDYIIPFAEGTFFQKA